jgi:hypothetical protein
MRKIATSCLVPAIAIIVAGCAGNGSSVTPLSQATVYGVPQAGDVDGTPAQAKFSNPAKVEVGPNGAVYVADYDNSAVRMIGTDGKVSTLAKQANFSQPFGLTYSPDGFLYVSTDANDLGVKNSTSGTVWRIDVKKKLITVVAANLGRPRGLCAISKTEIALGDIIHHTVSILNTATKTVTPLAGMTDQTGHVNANGTSARFNRPYGLCRLPDGSLLVADANNNCLRQVTIAGDVTDYAGTTVVGAGNGNRLVATFHTPQDVTYSNGNIYVADTGNHLVRRITGDTAFTEAGDGTAGFILAPGLLAEFYGLEGIGMRSGSNTLWIADGSGGDGSDHNHVRKITVP